MDPNTTLAEALELAQAILSGELSADSQLDASERLAEKVQALDDWITRGGFLPGAWQS